MRAAARFLIGFGAGFASLILGLVLLFAVLDQTGRLKAPSFANRLSFDAKVQYLRENPPEDVELVLVGSSTTLHGIDGSILAEELDLQGRVLNLGVQDLRVNQVRFVASEFLPRYPGASHVMMVSATLDYKDCGGAETRFFDPEHVLDYLNHDSIPYYYYFKYLDIAGTLERARELPRLRRTIADLESIAFDDHGSLLLDVPRERISDRVWEGDPITLDPSCYEALRGLAEDLRKRDTTFTFVIAPMRPGYLEGRDPEGTLLEEHLHRLERALRGTGTIVIDAHEALDMPEEVFFDAYHLKREEAREFTRFVSERLLAALSPLAETSNRPRRFAGPSVGG